jgi:GT2 family glycosyltransferase
LPSLKVTVVVPTLTAGDALAECVRALERQTFRDFEVVVVDNSGSGLAGEFADRVRMIRNERNLGFGAAINQGYRSSTAPYIAALNDDAVAHPDWLRLLVNCAEKNLDAGMFASEVRMAGTGLLDSAGMLIAPDGSSKQRGHGEPPEKYRKETEALFPSGSAALYRSKMLDKIGAFDESFFLYCEDTDLGLRALWDGWRCLYVPGARVEHRYSHSAGKASLLKAYYVERNRLYTVIKNFPLVPLAGAPFAAVARYFWHVASLLEGQGKAAEFREDGHSPFWLPFLVLRAHLAALFRLPKLLAERRRIFRDKKIGTADFRRMLDRHSISVRKVAAL